MTDKDLEEFLENYLSAFIKICPVCDAKFKDTLDVMIFCKVCERNDKIKKILND